MRGKLNGEESLKKFLLILIFIGLSGYFLNIKKYISDKIVMHSLNRLCDYAKGTIPKLKKDIDPFNNPYQPQKLSLNSRVLEVYKISGTTTSTIVHMFYDLANEVGEPDWRCKYLEQIHVEDCSEYVFAKKWCRRE